MKKWKEQWKELLPYEKYASIALQIVGASVIPLLIASVLQLEDVIRSPFDFRIASQIGMSLYSVCWVVRCWRKQRGTAILYVVLAALFAFGAILNLL